MEYKAKRKLKKLTNKQIAEDIKKYIKSSNEFYSTKIPELKTLAKRLYEEYNLKDFYKIFNKLWKSTHGGERYLALNVLQLHKEEFDLTTWEFLKPRLKEIKSKDNADIVGSEIIGNIALKYPELKNDVFEMMKSDNIWFRRIAVMSIISFIKNDDLNSAVELIERCIHEKDGDIQKTIGRILTEIGDKNPEILKNILMKNTDIPEKTFFYATEKIKNLRNIKKSKTLKQGNFSKWFFWKN
jgi:3-methyladenine DNA glycosylase AlkD